MAPAQPEWTLVDFVSAIVYVIVLEFMTLLLPGSQRTVVDVSVVICALLLICEPNLSFTGTRVRHRSILGTSLS